ncbi:uncharacterized protein LOC105631832 isoform X2 [Jatropha curcas]|uniref:uncharacterized protein LOC105631832 isoform X2 n=1 Tax=Jatropha curcas TaxID=180498 RepID=UPI001893613C|nr:uncharacterized protein LOC105631832 isoform X2 [Jatropha curcas]
MHELMWRADSTLKPFKFMETRVSKHKRSVSDPVERKVEKHQASKFYLASHNIKLNKMEQLKDCVEDNNRQPPSTEVEDSLKEEIVALQDQLQDQFVTRNALEKAMRSYSYTPFSYAAMNNKSVPKETKELIKEVAVLELEVVYMERYLLSLYRNTFDQQMSSYSSIDERCKMNSIMHKGVFPEVPREDIITSIHSSVNQSSIFSCNRSSSANQNKECNGSSETEKLFDSSIHQCHFSRSQRSFGISSPAMKSITRAVDAYHSLPLSMLEKAQNNYSSATSLAEHLGTGFNDYLLETPNSLSEEMIRCISAIYCELADPPMTDHDYPSSPGASFSPSTNELPTQGQGETWSPPSKNFSSFNSSLDNPFHIGDSKEFNGPYSIMAKVQWIHRDSQKLKAMQHKLQHFRSLVSQLEAVNPRNLKYEEKLAFWINVHNALIMHAFLVYGIPKSNTKRMSLVLKAAYNVGGHTINVDMIQSSILGCQLLRPGQWLRQLFFSKTKFKVGDPRKAYSIDLPEPRLHFALCAGSSSDPAVCYFRFECILPRECSKIWKLQKKSTFNQT